MLFLFNKLLLWEMLMRSKLILAVTVYLLCFASASYAEIKDDNFKLGVTLYNSACKICHAPDKAKAMTAPVAFNKMVWLKRFNVAEKNISNNFKFKTVNDYMLYQVKLGKGLMHHGGLCEESKVINKKLDCSNKAYLQAIEYMAQ